MVHGRGGEGVRHGRPRRGLPRRRAAGEFAAARRARALRERRQDMGQYTIPTVIERTPQGERAYDVYSRLLADRIIFLGTEIDDGVANVVIAQLIHLESAAPEREISVYINSPGGSFTALMAIYDTMTFVNAPISTFCVGQAASTAAVLLAAGDPGRRAVLEHSRVLLGQPAAGGQRGTVSDLRLQAREMVRIRSQVEEVLSRHTGHEVARLRADMDRDKVFTAEEAVAYGLADQVVSQRVVGV
ncbi:ClpP family protease [Streptomyces sp. 6N223]|uniref:ClpP family protease n=1 Tax=Streptomyces sp. 6N223 TaxID=3457412 RepID=UPI003FCFF61B